MARAISTPERDLLNKQGQFTELYLAIDTPEIVFQAQIKIDIVGSDEIGMIEYDRITFGADTDIIAGQTVYIGTTVGAWDIGTVRVRQAIAGKMLIGRTSHIAYKGNMFITVVNEFNLWAKHWKPFGLDTYFMDDDLNYAGHFSYCDPVPVFGSDLVLWLKDGAAVITPDASGSWVLDSNIASYEWYANKTAVVVDNLTATPTITFNQAGSYIIACRVTTATARRATGRRVVFVFDEDHSPYKAKISGCSASIGDAGWSFTAEIYGAEAIHERAKCILFSRDFYYNEQGEYGPLPGSENIVVTGWLDSESVRRSPLDTSVRFKVSGPGKWMGKLSTMPAIIKNVAGIPVGWTGFPILRIDAAVWILTYWRSTVAEIMDVIPSGDLRVVNGFSCPAGNLLAQLRFVAEQSIMASPICDRYGRLFIQVDTQYLDVADRAAPVVMDITKKDWKGQIDLERVNTTPTSILETSGIDLNLANWFSHSMGAVNLRYGGVSTRDNLCVQSQDQLNKLTGMIFAKENNEFPSVNLDMPQINRFIDIAPLQRVTISMAANENGRGLIWVNKKFIPRRVDYQVENNVVTVGLDLEAETSGEPGITVIPPETVVITKPPKPPIGKKGGFTGSKWYPPKTGKFKQGTCENGDSRNTNGPWGLNFDKGRLLPGEDAFAYLPCAMRPYDPFYGHFTPYTYTSRVIVNAALQFIDSEFLELVAVAADKTTVLAPGARNGNIFYFEPIACTDIIGFKLHLGNPNYFNWPEKGSLGWEQTGFPYGWGWIHPDHPMPLGGESCTFGVVYGVVDGVVGMHVNVVNGWGMQAINHGFRKTYISGEMTTMLGARLEFNYQWGNLSNNEDMFVEMVIMYADYTHDSVIFNFGSDGKGIPTTHYLVVSDVNALKEVAWVTIIFSGWDNWASFSVNYIALYGFQSSSGRLASIAQSFVYNVVRNDA